ncbi:MAG: alkaline phosphatase family protein [Acidobacteriota bacterium]|nr:alkaline phosphatase family protein [Acidobacteriota bacterium]
MEGSKHDTPGPATEIRVDELRMQLRKLGYLDAGIDRFVLGPTSTVRSPLAIAALGSLRIGVLAAVLLGPAAAVGIGTRFPGLVTNTSDAVVIAIYLALLFGAAATLVSFLAGLIVGRLPIAWVSGRARSVSRGAGVLVGGACLAYLTLWWRIANPDLASLSAAWTAAALAIEVAISLLLGHATAITAFAVIVASHPEAAPAAERRSTWKLTVAAGVLAFAAAAGLLLMTAPAPASAAPAPNLAVVSPGLRVRLIAVDGLDPAAMRELAATGRIPNLSRMLEGGSVLIPAPTVRDPARDWTTIATGQPPDVHGVQGLETRRVAGLQGSVTSSRQEGMMRALRGASDMLRLTRPSTASGAELRSKTIWEVAADAGLRAAVINWWATWPASTGGANPPIVLSDRATLRLERGGALDGEIAPAALYDRIRAEWPAITSEAQSLMTALMPVAAEAETSAVLRRAAEVDALQVVMARRVQSPSLDLIALYLPGLDIAQHALLGAGAAASPSALQARLEGVRSYYIYLDGLLKDALVPGADELVVLLAQPGRLETINLGLIAARGAIAAAGVTGSARAVDVAPTVLHVLGLPVSREVVGAPILNLVSTEFAGRFPVRAVESYGRRVSPAGLRDGQPLDQEMIERLRSLGYVR